MSHVRPANAEDIPAILRIAAEASLSEWTENDYRSESLRPDAILLISESAERKVQGFISGRIVPGPVEDILEAEIYNIGVAADVRRQTIGSTLLSEFRNAAKTIGVSRIWLEVRESNAAARAFYRDHGFGEVNIRRNFYRQPVEHAIIMVLEEHNGYSSEVERVEIEM